MLLGRFASGSIDKKIYLYDVRDESFSSWKINEKPYVFHSASVEDIIFSPVEDFKFASCNQSLWCKCIIFLGSVDKTICICDIRTGNYNKPELSFKAHNSDVNVISWNQKNPFFIASGADDGSFKIWDYRNPSEEQTEIKWHTEQITSIDFQPGDESVVAVSSADNRLSIWDMSVEKDETKNKEGLNSVPENLIFLHQGQEEIKEIK